MPRSNIKQVRPQGFALLSYGFRPFFLLGSAYGVLMIGLWVPWFLGLIRLPSAFSPAVWHAHELLFGFFLAVMAGFLLTAVASWTSRPAVRGALLGALAVLWLAGRIAVAVSRDIDEMVIAAVCLLFPIALTIIMAREVGAAGNQRNFKTVALVGSLAVADAVFHYEAWLTGRARLSTALAISLVLIVLIVIAGRIVPNVTPNWLKANRPGLLPRPFGTFDVAAAAISVAALGAWVLSRWFLSKQLPQPGTTAFTGVLLLAAAAANLLRQWRWRPMRTFAEPLAAVLHVAYLFVAIGFALVGAALLAQNYDVEAAGLHAWTTGAFATMILAVMTRTTRGHTGNALSAPWSTVAIYASIVAAALARIASSLLPGMTLVLVPVSGVLWIAAFLGFLLLYGRMLVMPRAQA